MSAKRAILLTGPTADVEDQHLADLLSFLGVPCTVVCDQKKFEDENKAGEQGLIVAAGTLGNLLHGSAQDRHRVRAFVDSFDSVLIYGVTPSALAEADLRFVTGGEAVRFAELRPDENFSVSDQHRSLCNALSGLQIERRSGGATHGIRLESPACDVDTLIGVGDAAVFVGLTRENSRMFLSTSTQVVDLAERVTSNFEATTVFDRLVPYMIFARAVFADACWKPKRQSACLVIDDPLLRRRYGFLDLVGLLHQLDEWRIAVNLAFIPWNFDRSRRTIVDLIRRTDRFALCVHGCDHTRGEFGSDDELWLDSLVQLALERMDRHRERTGIAHEQIMVFPQGIFSDQAMSVLKRRNFMAAINTEVVSHHHSPRQSQLPLGELLNMANTAYASFPLFTRRTCDGPLANYALDIFVGKPCLLVAHHQYFRSSFAPLVRLVSAINCLDSALQWATLETVLKESYQWRQLPGGATAVRMFANQITLENNTDCLISFEITKRERDNGAVNRVLINDQAVEFEWKENHVRFVCHLGPGQKVTVRVDYQGTALRERKLLSFSYRARSATRRYLSEIRDDYVQPLQHLLRGSPR